MVRTVPLPGLPNRAPFLHDFSAHTLTRAITSMVAKPKARPMASPHCPTMTRNDFLRSLSLYKENRLRERQPPFLRSALLRCFLLAEHRSGDRQHAEDFRDAPRLRATPTRSVRRLGVENFADVADAGGREVLSETH